MWDSACQIYGQTLSLELDGYSVTELHVHVDYKVEKMKSQRLIISFQSLHNNSKVNV